MFVIVLNYKRPIEIVDHYLVEHRTFLEKYYQQDAFIASGPRNPRTGGIILSQLKNREKLDEILREDPFYVHGIAEYEVMEFEPVKFHKDFEKFI